MAITNFVKRIQDVMRNDAGVNGDAQRIEQIVWTLFLKIYDAKEEEWELINDDYTSIIPDEFKWRNWAVDNKMVRLSLEISCLILSIISFFLRLKILKYQRTRQ